MGTRVQFVVDDGEGGVFVRLFSNSHHNSQDPQVVFRTLAQCSQGPSDFLERLLSSRYASDDGGHRRGDRMFWPVADDGDGVEAVETASFMAAGVVLRTRKVSVVPSSSSCPIEPRPRVLAYISCEATQRLDDQSGSEAPCPGAVGGVRPYRDSGACKGVIELVDIRNIELAVAMEAEECARLCEKARPFGGRAWDEAQAGVFEALTHVADFLRSRHARAADLARVLTGCHRGSVTPAQAEQTAKAG